MPPVETYTFALQTTAAPEGTPAPAPGISALVMPWGVEVVHQGERIMYDVDSVTVDPERTVPLSIDHGDGVLTRIGLLSGFTSKPDGLYADFSISDTTAGRDTRQLLLDGVLDEVSAGVALNLGAEYSDAFGIRHRFGVLDHVSVVGRGAFGKAGARVLAVHSQGVTMDPVQNPATPAAPADPATPIAHVAAHGEDPVPVVAQYASAEEVERLQRAVAALTIPGAVSNPVHEFKSTQEFVLTLAAADRGDRNAQARIAEYALADDTTTTAVGVVPDYHSNDVISIIDTERPFIQSIPNDPIGSEGMSVVYPEVKVKPTVDVQAAEKTEVDSTAMDIDPKSVALSTIAGASDVSRQLIERSQPSFVDMLFREYASAYAQKSEGLAIAAAVTGAGGTAVLADLGASASATRAAFNLANKTVITGVRQPITHVACGVDRWEQINNLEDTTGRPLLVFPEDGPSNADGQITEGMAGRYRGATWFLAPDAPAATCLLYNRNRFAAVLESAPVQLQAEVVSLLGMDLGVYGLFAAIVKYAAGGYTLTAV